MNPCYNTQPFTAKEDKALIAAAKKTNASPDDWNAVALKFPSRNPRSLLNRWMELGKKEDVAKLQGNQLMKRGLRRIGRRVLRSTRNKKVVRDEGDDVLTASDFAVRFKKKQRTDER